MSAFIDMNWTNYDIYSLYAWRGVERLEVK